MSENIFSIPRTFDQLMTAYREGDISIPSRIEDPNCAPIEFVRRFIEVGKPVTVFCPGLSEESADNLVSYLRKLHRKTPVHVYLSTQPITGIPDPAVEIHRLRPYVKKDKFIVVTDTMVAVATGDRRAKGYGDTYGLTRFDVYPVQAPSAASKVRDILAFIREESSFAEKVAASDPLSREMAQHLCDGFNNILSHLADRGIIFWARRNSQHVLSRSGFRVVAAPIQSLMLNDSSKQIDLNVPKIVHESSVGRAIYILVTKSSRLAKALLRLREGINMLIAYEVQEDTSSAEWALYCLQRITEHLDAPLETVSLVTAAYSYVAATNRTHALTLKFKGKLDASERILCRNKACSIDYEYDVLPEDKREVYRKFLELLSILLPEDIVVGQAANTYLHADKLCTGESVYFSNPVGMLFARQFRPSMNLIKHVSNLQTLCDLCRDGSEKPGDVRAVWRCLAGCLPSVHSAVSDR